jgi:hypothetical protein
MGSKSYRQVSRAALKTGNYWPWSELSVASDRSVPPVTRKRSDAQKCLARPLERGRVQAPQSRPASRELHA